MYTKNVEKEKVINLLKSLDIYDDVTDGKCCCAFCDSVITVDNIDSILPVDGEMAFTCDSEEFHNKLVTGVEG